MKKIRAIVSGRVQGVGFRVSTLSQARKIGVSGYVRNLANGDVEIVALGDRDRVDELLQWAKVGPPLAIVSHLKVEALTSEVEKFEGFEIRS